MSLGTGDMAESNHQALGVKYFYAESVSNLHPHCQHLQHDRLLAVRADMTHEVHLIFVSLQLTMLPLQMLPQQAPVIISSPS